MSFKYKGFTICFERWKYDGMEYLQTRENADCVEILVEIFHTTEHLRDRVLSWSIILKSILEEKKVLLEVID